MPFDLAIPQPGGESLDVTLSAGETVFVLGANGTGKSTLMHQFYRTHYGNARRISAHRQSWFSSNAITLSPDQRRNTENSIQGADTNPQARWQDDYGAQRASIAIYDLIDAENVRARTITAAVDADAMELARTLSKRDAPIRIINELLRLSNLPIELSVKENEQVVARKSDGPPYSIAELSDGERSALLIAATVLTVKEGTLILIDEPERHLHRSIISPLLTALFAKRPDCAFVVSTHEVMLPLDNPDARTLLVRSCVYVGQLVTSWSTDLVPADADIDDDLKTEILGARRKILFIEGTERSLDKPLYSLLFPNVSVIPKSSCTDVEHVVFGIREAAGLHWVGAFGIVDNDRRTQDDRNRLKERGVHALDVFSVESLYYHPEVLRLIAERHAMVIGEDAGILLEQAKNAALLAVKPHVQRLAAQAAENTIREEFLRHVPRREDVVAEKPVELSIDVAASVKEERESLEQLLATADLARVIARYAVRETPALHEIARKLGFQSRDQYEGSVLKLLMDDEAALTRMKALFGALHSDLQRVS